jgi:hypothetical protein
VVNDVFGVLRVSGGLGEAAADGAGSLAFVEAELEVVADFAGSDSINFGK